MEGIEIARKRLKTCRDQHELAYKNEIDKIEEAEKELHDALEKLNTKKQDAADAYGEAEVSDDELVEINAGGKIIVARRATLTQMKGTRLEAIFSGRWDKRLQRDGKGRIFLDVNPACFQAIVDYLNEMIISPPEHPPEPPSVDSELDEILSHLLDLLGISDEVMLSQSKVTPRMNDWMVIRNWLREENFNGSIKLLFRTSLDGYSASTLRKKCTAKGPTLTLVKDVEGNLFGGFVSDSWSELCLSAAVYAHHAFLFALTGDGIDNPVKLSLKEGKQSHHTNSNWLSFGPRSTVALYSQEPVHPDLTIQLGDGSYTFKIGSSYEMPESLDNFISRGCKEDFSEMEIYQIVPNTNTADLNMNSISTKATDVSGFSPEINDALTARWQAVHDAGVSLTILEDFFADEEGFISSFAVGEDKDTVLLSVSGTEMATKRSTLRLCEDSALARQFDDSMWKQQGHGSHTPVSNWNPDEVLSWINDIDGVNEEVTTNFRENLVNGNELLALGKDGLEDLGVTRKGTLYLILKEIKKLEQMDECPVTFIEHSPYCFEKIVDYLRVKAAFSEGLIPIKPSRPIARGPENGRFQKVVKYFFPGECSKFILG